VEVVELRCNWAIWPQRPLIHFDCFIRNTIPVILLGYHIDLLSFFFFSKGFMNKLFYLFRKFFNITGFKIPVFGQFHFSVSQYISETIQGKP